MTIEQKALELVNAVERDLGYVRHETINAFDRTLFAVNEALCRALEAHEADKSRHAAEMQSESEESYKLGERDGAERAWQEIDLLTGGDGEYFASTMPGEGCPDAQAMKLKVIRRFNEMQAELREQAERFSEAAGKAKELIEAGVGNLGVPRIHRAVFLEPFILAPADPLAEVMRGTGCEFTVL